MVRECDHCGKPYEMGDEDCGLCPRCDQAFWSAQEEEGDTPEPEGAA